MPEQSVRTMNLSDGNAVPRRGVGLLALGGLLGAMAASSCCIVPLVFFSLGAGGAWIGNLTAMAAYQVYFVPLTLAFLGAGFYFVYRKPKVTCVDEAACARPMPQRLVKAGLWGAAALTAAALAFPYVGPWMLGID